MVRYEDPPGNVKHIRFGRLPEKLSESLMKIPGVKSIVRHAGGSNGGSYKEHPHYHVWWEGVSGEAITNQTWRDRAKKLDPVFKQFKGQQDWSFRNHDNWSAWANYVCTNFTHKVILPHKDIEEVSNQKALVLAVPAPAAPPLSQAPRVITKRLPMRERFISYLLQERGWKLNGQFSESAHNADDIKDEVIAACTEYWEAAFTSPEGIRMVRHAIWKFGDEGVKDWLKAEIASSIKNSLF